MKLAPLMLRCIKILTALENGNIHRAIHQDLLIKVDHKVNVDVMQDCHIVERKIKFWKLNECYLAGDWTIFVVTVEQ